MGAQNSSQGNQDQSDLVRRYLAGDGKEGKDGDKKKPNYEKPPPPTIGSTRKKRGAQPANRLPEVNPRMKCKLRMMRMERIKDYLVMEEELIDRMKAAHRTGDDNAVKNDNVEEAVGKMFLEDLRKTHMRVGTLEEIIDDDHAIVSLSEGFNEYVLILNFVDKSLLYPTCTVLLHKNLHHIVGVLDDDTDPLIHVMKLDRAPTETYADIAGMEAQIQEIRETVELPLTHPELYEELGIKPPKGVILYGSPGTGKTLLARAVASRTNATFLRIGGPELIQKYSGEGPKLVRQIFQVAAEHAPAIVFIDEIDAVGSKRYNTTSSGGKEIQRTMLELLNQLDGFDERKDVKVIMATNRIESLDPALIRPGRIDRKIEFENPDEKTKRKIFALCTSKMTLDQDVDLEELIAMKDDLSGADIKAICMEAGLIALRERRMTVKMEDLKTGRDKVMKTKTNTTIEGIYL